jgi:membrane protein DedA with SNARE-associated domain
MPFLSHADVTDLLNVYGYWTVGGIIALESVGFPLPGELTLLAAGVYAGTTHQLNIVVVIAAAACGAALGAMVGYWIGRKFGFWLLLRYGRYLRLNEARLKLGQYLFARYGGLVVLAGRFTVLLRAPAALLAGACRMCWPRFLLFNAIGACVWASLYGTAAYYLGHEIHRLAGLAGAVISAISLAGFIAVAIFLRRHEAELLARAEKALPGPLQPVPTEN